MRTIHLLTKTATLVVCLSTATMVFAQGKLAKSVTEGLLKAPRNYRGTVQHFVLPGETIGGSLWRRGEATLKIGDFSCR